MIHRCCAILSGGRTQSDRNRNAEPDDGSACRYGAREASKTLSLTELGWYAAKS